MLENKLSVFNLYKGVDKEIRIFLDLIQSDFFVSRSGRVIFCDLLYSIPAVPKNLDLRPGNANNHHVLGGCINPFCG